MSLLIRLAAAAFFACPAAAAAAPKPGEPADLVLIFDTSGSMNDPVRGGRKLDLGKAAIWKFAEMLPKNVSVGLVTFHDGCEVRTVSPLQPASAHARGRLRADIAGLQAQGSTPIGYALQLATRMLAGSQRKKRIVILTDGEETCDEGALMQASDEAWKRGIKVYAIGFAMGSEPSRNFRRLGIYKDAGDDAQLASVFTDIRRSLEKESAQYDESKKDPAQVLQDRPAVLNVGRRGYFKASGARAGRLYSSLQLKSSYEPKFTQADRFTVLEHGYHVLFNPEEYTAEKVEVLKVRLEEKLNFTYGGAEGFVLANDVVIE